MANVGAYDPAGDTSTQTATQKNAALTTPVIPPTPPAPVTPTNPNPSVSNASSLVPAGQNPNVYKDNNTNPAPIAYDSQGNPIYQSTLISNAASQPPPTTNAPTAGTTPSTTGTSTYNGATLNSTQTDYENTVSGISDQITKLANGTTPLTAGEQSQVDALQAQFEQTIATQNLVNTSTSNSAQVRGFQTGVAEFDRSFQANTISSIVAAGANKITDLQTKEAGAIATLTQSLQNNDISNLKTAYDTYTSAHADVAKSISDLVVATQQGMNDNAIANVISSGVTDPKDILAELQKNGYTDISSTDIANAIKNLSPDAQNILAVQKTAAANGAPQKVLATIGASKNQADAVTAAGVYNTTLIPDLQKLAEANGAPQKVIDAIGQSTDSSSAFQAAAGYTQTATGVLGDYLEYQRQAIAAGQVPEDYTTFKAAQDAQTSATAIKQAVTIADDEASYKAQVDANNGVLSSGDNTRVNATISQLAANKDVQAFTSIAGQLPILNSIPAGTTDPAQQAALLASVAHILSPNSSSLRGALNAIDPSALDSDTYSFLNNLAKVGIPRGGMSGDAVNKLIAIGNNEYTQYLNTYNTIRSAAIAPLTAQGIDANKYIPDYSQVGATSTTQNVIQTTAQQDTTVQNGLKAIKTSNPTLYSAASKMYTSMNPATGQPYTPSDILQAFPELATQ